MSKEVSYITKEDGIISVKKFDYVDDVTVGLSPEMFLTEDEIVYDIVNNRLSKDDAADFKNMSEDDIIIQHMSFGMWIRNTYGLWECSINPLTSAECAPDSMEHPDNLSGEIMDLVKQTLLGEYTPDVTFATESFDDAMKVLGEE